MSDQKNNEISNLEIQLAHQQQIIDELNDVVLRHEKAISLLEARLINLAQQFQEMGEGQGEILNTPPPHY